VKLNSIARQHQRRCHRRRLDCTVWWRRRHDRIQRTCWRSIRYQSRHHGKEGGWNCGGCRRGVAHKNTGVTTGGGKKWHFFSICWGLVVCSTMPRVGSVPWFCRAKCTRWYGAMSEGGDSKLARNGLSSRQSRFMGFSSHNRSIPSYA
jgi:hypothetical protein